MSYIPRLQTQYAEEIAPALKKQFEYTSAMQVPRIEKICLNQGLGKAVADRKMVDTAVEEMSTIAGQKAVPTLSTKDVSNFKLRKGMPIGARVTLRRERMYEFLDRLIAVSCPVRVTSKVSRPRALTAAETSRLASKSKSSTLRLISMRSRTSTGWTSPL